MKTQTRDSGTQREPKLWSVFHRVSPAKWLALIFVARAMSFATGCSSQPAAGTLGGKCLQGCEHDTCNDGSVCDEGMDLCVAASGDGRGPGACTEAFVSPLCDANGQAFLCNDPASSEDPKCVVVATTDTTTTFCCEYGPLDDDSGVDPQRDAASSATLDAAADVVDADTMDADASDE